MAMSSSAGCVGLCSSLSVFGLLLVKVGWVDTYFGSSHCPRKVISERS